MIIKIEAEGYWKIAGCENWQVTGRINFDIETGIKLSIIGGFTKNENPQNEKIHSIHGFTTDGMQITLLDCYVGYNHPSPGIITGTIFAEYLITGGYFSNINEIKVKNTAVNYNHLDEWFNVSGVSVIGNSNIGRSPFETTLSYKQPSPIKLYSNDNKDIFVWFSSKSPALSGKIKDNTISQKAYINFQYKNQTQLGVALDDIKHFRNFFAFGLSKVIFPTEINAYIEIDGGASEKKISIMYKERDANSYYEDYISESYTLFSYTNVKDTITKIVKNWIDNYPKLKPVYDRYFDCIYNLQLYEFNQFLNRISAIETYHRRTSNNKLFANEEFTKIKNELKNALPDPVKNKVWFDRTLSFANELSLRERLNEMFDKFNFALDEIIDNRVKFIGDLVDIRNYYTHYSTKPKNIDIDTVNLSHYSSRLEIILQVSLLSELGFTKEEIKKAVRRPIRNWGCFDNNN